MFTDCLPPLYQTHEVEDLTTTALVFKGLRTKCADTFKRAVKPYEEAEVRVDSLEETAMLSFEEYTGITIHETKEKLAPDKGRNMWTHMREPATLGEVQMLGIQSGGGR